jgi:hypothetical protein
MSEVQAVETTRTLTEAEAAAIAKAEGQIAKLREKIAAIIAGKPAKAAKVVFIPEVGATVLATIGRATATSQPKVVEAVVLGVKKPAEGEKGATLVRVRTGEGFDEQNFTVFLTQVAPLPVAEEDDGISNEPLGSLVNA